MSSALPADAATAAASIPDYAQFYAHSYPREIAFLTELPKTPSGKLQRFILRNQEVAKTKF